MLVPRRGQRGAGVADEESSELRFRQRNTRVADGEVAAPRRRQRGFGATDKERLQCRGGDFSFVDAASRKLSLRKENLVVVHQPGMDKARSVLQLVASCQHCWYLVDKEVLVSRKTLHRNHNADEGVLVRVCI